MENKDRQDDLPQDLPRSIEDVSPGERIELVFKLSEIAYPPDPKTAAMTREERREARKNWPVKKFY